MRFNANAFNARYVPDVYRMVKELGINETEFELYNTVNYDYNLPVPTLNKEQYNKLYLDLVKLKFEHGDVIKDFPRPTFATCAAYTHTTSKSRRRAAWRSVMPSTRRSPRLTSSQAMMARWTPTRTSSPATSSTIRSKIRSAGAARISAFAEESTSAKQTRVQMSIHAIFSSSTWTIFYDFLLTRTLSHQIGSDSTRYNSLHSGVARLGRLPQGGPTSGFSALAPRTGTRPRK